MKRRIPLAAKLGVSFIVVILLAVALVYGLILWSIPQQFDEYRRSSRTTFGNQVALLLANYREDEGSWDGVAESLLSRPRVVALGQESLIGSVSIFDVEITLFDANGVMITTNAWTWLTRQEYQVYNKEHHILWSASDTPTDESIPIFVNDQQQGTLYVGDIENPTRAESDFLSTVTESALIGGGIAIGVALFLSTMLIVQILRPLRVLSRATERVAEGDMPDKVSLKTQIGRAHV